MNLQDKSKEKGKVKSVSLHGLDVFSAMVTIYEDGSVSVNRLWKKDAIGKEEYGIYKKLAGKGLHREVTYTIRLENLDKKKQKISNDING